MNELNQLYVVSGPPCSGKTYFIKNLLSSPEHINKLNLDLNYSVINANEVRKSLTNFELKTNMVVHYDSLRSFKRCVNVNEFSDPFLNYLKSFKNITFIIINTQPKILIQRMNERISRLKSTVDPQRMNKLTRLLELYKDEEMLKEQDNKWFKFCQGISKSKIFMYYSQDDKLIKLNQFKLNHSKF